MASEKMYFFPLLFMEEHNVSQDEVHEAARTLATDSMNPLHYFEKKKAARTLRAARGKKASKKR